MSNGSNVIEDMDQNNNDTLKTIGNNDNIMMEDVEHYEYNNIGSTSPPRYEEYSNNNVVNSFAVTSTPIQSHIYNNNNSPLSQFMMRSSSTTREHQTCPPNLASTYSLNRQYSSPSVLDASPKASRKCGITVAQSQLPSTPTTANLTPIIRNTNEASPTIISPDSELNKMSIPLLSTQPQPPCDISADQILLTRLPRSFTNSRQLHRTLTSSSTPFIAAREEEIRIPGAQQHQHQLRQLQYQPSRDNSFTDFGIAEPEELSIFLDSEGNSIPSIPLDERQFSIPSIRLANHLGDSTASFTCSEDEDDLWVVDEKASPFFAVQYDNDANDINTSLGDITDLAVASIASEAADIDTSFDSTSPNDENNVQVLFRKKKDDPYEWLQQMRGDGILVEAASSKFLTRGHVI